MNVAARCKGIRTRRAAVRRRMKGKLPPEYCYHELSPAIITKQWSGEEHMLRVGLRVNSDRVRRVDEGGSLELSPFLINWSARETRN